MYKAFEILQFKVQLIFINRYIRDIFIKPLHFKTIEIKTPYSVESI